MVVDHWRADDYASHASYVSSLSDRVMRDLAPQPGEAVLDLGCGDGELARELMNAGCRVVGIDSSESLVASAVRRGVDAHVGDAQVIDFDEEFDAVFSNAALHWMPRQAELASRAHRALKPGGRFVVEMGGKGNIARLRSAMTLALSEIGKDFNSRDPWTFPEPDAQRYLLEKTGFVVRDVELRERPTVLPTDVRGWLVTFTHEILADLDAAERERVIDRMVEICRPDMCDAEGRWTVDYVRLNFVATKPDARA